MARSRVHGNIDYQTIINGYRVVLRGVRVSSLSENSRILGAVLKDPKTANRGGGFYVAGDTCPSYVGREAFFDSLGYTVSAGRVVWVAYSPGVPAFGGSGESRLRMTPRSGAAYFVPCDGVLVDSAGGYRSNRVKFPTQIAATEWFMGQSARAPWPYEITLKRWHRDAMERAVAVGFAQVAAYRWGDRSPKTAADQIEGAMRSEIGPLSAPPGLVWAYGSGIYGGLTGSSDSVAGPVVVGLINPEHPAFPVALLMASHDRYHGGSHKVVTVRCGYFGPSDAWCDHEGAADAGRWSSFHHRHQSTYGGFVNQVLTRSFLKLYPTMQA